MHHEVSGCSSNNDAHLCPLVGCDLDSPVAGGALVSETPISRAVVLAREVQAEKVQASLNRAGRAPRDTWWLSSSAKVCTNFRPRSATCNQAQAGRSALGSTRCIYAAGWPVLSGIGAAGRLRHELQYWISLCSADTPEGCPGAAA